MRALPCGERTCLRESPSAFVWAEILAQCCSISGDFAHSSVFFSLWLDKLIQAISLPGAGPEQSWHLHLADRTSAGKCPLVSLFSVEADGQYWLHLGRILLRSV